jgi:hypothetical protein
MNQIDVLLDPLRDFAYQAVAFLPRLAIAVLVLLVGLLLARAARYAIEHGLRAINLHVVTRRSGLDDFLHKGGTDSDTVRVFGVLVYWIVILAALIVAFNSLGLTTVTDLLSRVMLFVPRLIVALLILAFGTYFARFVGNAVASYCAGIGMSDGAALGRLARYAILVFVLVVAIDHLELGGVLIRTTFLILLGGVVLALALAFGLGGREWAAARLHEWWPPPERPRRPPPLP